MGKQILKDGEGGSLSGLDSIARKRPEKTKRPIKFSWNLEVANQQFEELCDRFAKIYPTSASYAKSARRAAGGARRGAGDAGADCGG
jgi:hypothetical protein